VLGRNRRKPGPKGKPLELVNLVVNMKAFNPTFGTPRIAMQINSVSEVKISEPTVRRILKRHWKPVPLGPKELRNLFVALLGVGIAGFAYTLFSTRLTLRRWWESIKKYTEIAPKKLDNITNSRDRRNGLQPELSASEKILATQPVPSPIVLMFQQNTSEKAFSIQILGLSRQKGTNLHCFSRDGPCAQLLKMIG